MNEQCRIDYSSIGQGFTLHVPLKLLSPRDKVVLFQKLLDDLGITEQFSAYPDETGFAQQLITEQWDKHWNAK